MDLEREIEDWFRIETRLDMVISLGRTTPPIDEGVAREVAVRARAAGYLAQCVDGRLLVKRPSRFRSSPSLAKPTRRLLRTA